MIAVAAVLVLVVGPLLLGLLGIFQGRHARSAADPAMRWNWRLTIVSTLLYTLAFNLTFFIQELFLVLPKALTPGLKPTLFHNNHGWEGEHPLANLFQGTGALATLLAAILCMLLLRRDSIRSTTIRLFLVWMAYCGFFMALPQVVIGALSPGSDVGRAMDYFALGATAKNMAALMTLAAIPSIARLFTPLLLSLAEDAPEIANAWARTRFIFLAATLPALIATALIIPFRIPRELIEVVMLPVLVTVVGLAWIQAGAWRSTNATADGEQAGSIAYPLGATVLLLLVFQFVLRPGIDFY